MQSGSLTGESHPWLTMAFSPRRTIRRIVARKPKRSLTRVAALMGVVSMLGQLSSSGAGDHLILPLLLIIAFVGGSLVGVVVNYCMGLVLNWVGAKLGGHASVDSVRAAYAWCWIPSIWGLALWLPAIAVFGSELFTRTGPAIDAGIWRGPTYIGFFVVEFVAGTWSLVLFIVNISEVEEFSVWRSLATVLLSLMIILAVFAGVGAFISGLRL